MPLPAQDGPLRDTGLSEILFEASPDCVKLLDEGGSILRFNRNGLCVMEIDDPGMVEGKYWPDLWPEASRGVVEAALLSARTMGSASFAAECPTAKGANKWWDVVVTVFLSPGNGGQRFVAVSRDITEQRAAAATDRAMIERLEAAAVRQDTLAGEMAHRVSNLVAVIDGVYRQTARASETVEDLSAAFSNRLAAIGRGLTVLIRGDWSGASLRELARVQLAPFIDAGRLEISGPDVTLAVTVAQPLALALNELATNALKYGALSLPSGRVALTWDVQASDLIVTWRESGGPAVTPPTRQGMGSRLIERGIRDADVERNFESTGVVCTIRLPAKHITR